MFATPFLRLHVSGVHRHSVLQLLHVEDAHWLGPPAARRQPARPCPRPLRGRGSGQAPGLYALARIGRRGPSRPQCVLSAVPKRSRGRELGTDADACQVPNIPEPTAAAVRNSTGGLGLTFGNRRPPCRVVGLLARRVASNPCPLSADRRPRPACACRTPCQWLNCRRSGSANRRPPRCSRLARRRV